MTLSKTHAIQRLVQMENELVQTQKIASGYVDQRLVATMQSMVDFLKAALA